MKERGRKEERESKERGRKRKEREKEEDAEEERERKDKERGLDELLHVVRRVQWAWALNKRGHIGPKYKPGCCNYCTEFYILPEFSLTPFRSIL